ncbi:uncharacterized protein LOC111400499 [Olea europaea var. sylvestris]|uniref:uncharacterized protein LOC111400499 n=1 Tax=Olea europaea var. sylvestris TaxID=158386 RepID=UPI000C1D875D|nr:uncharacterized protein LOC111400499 [Olea europaea var. sylvestris]
MLTIVCTDDNCKWMLRASSVKQSAIFMIHKFNNLHTCSIDYRRNAYQHATSSVIAEQIMGKLDNTYGSYDPTAIARDVEREFGVKISYHQARRGKVTALHLLHGTSGDSFQKLSSYCHVQGESNPGTVTHIKVDSRNRFHYLFLAFGASIRCYLHYIRPVICVDDNHLKGPYKGTLLLATAQDANKQIYPLAKNSIENVIAHLFHRGSPRVLCLAYGKEFNPAFRRVSARAYGYLERAGFPFWSRALFVGQQYNILTNNNAESLNSMLRHARLLPIMCLVEHIRHTMQKWFYERQASLTACSTVLSPTMENELQTTFEAAESYAMRSGNPCYLFERNVLPEIRGTPIMPPSVRRPPGRLPTRRKRSRYEYTTRLRKCTRYGGLGHNRTTCSNHTVARPM